MELLSGLVNLLLLALLFICFLEKGATGQYIGTDPCGTTKKKDVSESDCGEDPACQKIRGVCLNPRRTNIPKGLRESGICSHKKGCFCYSSPQENGEAERMELDDPKELQFLPPVVVHKMEHYIETWENYKHLFHLEFDSCDEELFNKWTFEESLRDIKANNRVNTSSLQETNMFSHLTYDEFVLQYTGVADKPEVMMDVKLDDFLSPGQF